MRLVDHDQRDRARRHELTQGAVERLGSEKDELVVAPSERGQAGTALVEVERRVDLDRVEAERLHCVDLILHQADEWRNDQDRARQHTRRQLVRERLPGSGGHDGDAVLPVEHGVDHLALARAERIEAEDGAENCGGICDMGHGDGFGLEDGDYRNPYMNENRPPGTPRWMPGTP